MIKDQKPPEEEKTPFIINRAKNTKPFGPKPTQTTNSDPTMSPTISKTSAEYDPLGASIINQTVKKERKIENAILSPTNTISAHSTTNTDSQKTAASTQHGEETKESTTQNSIPQQHNGDSHSPEHQTLKLQNVPVDETSGGENTTGTKENNSGVVEGETVTKEI